MNARRALRNRYYTEVFKREKFLSKDDRQFKSDKEQSSQDLQHKANEKLVNRRHKEIEIIKQLENEFEDNIKNKIFEQQARQDNIECENKVAQEFEQRQVALLRDEKLRQQIRLNSQELRDLENKLKCALVSKEAAAQITEKILLKEKNLREEQEYNELLNIEVERQKCIEQEMEKARRKKEEAQAEELREHIKLNKRKKGVDNIEAIRERERIDEIVRSVKEEQQNAAERFLRHKQDTIKEMQEFKTKYKEWKEKEKQRMEEEDRQIENFNKMQIHRETVQKTMKQQLELAKAKVQKIVADILIAKQKEKEEIEQIHMDLRDEEEQEALHQREEKEMMDNIQQRLALQEDHKFQLQYKKMQQEREKEEEEKLKKELMEQFEKEHHLEQLTKEKRRTKILNYKNEMEKLLEQRRELRKTEKEREIEEWQKLLNKDKYLNDLIEEERQRLLQKYAPKLKEYLPLNVIRGKQDLELLGSEFKDMFGSRLFKKPATSKREDITSVFDYI